MTRERVRKGLERKARAPNLSKNRGLKDLECLK